MLQPAKPTARFFTVALTWIPWAGRLRSRRNTLALAATVLFAMSWVPTRAGEWQILFDGKTLEGWKVTDFAGRGEVNVENGRLMLHSGVMLTGVHIHAGASGVRCSSLSVPRSG